MRIFSLEDAISPDNQVRFIGAFVNFVDLMKLGFTVQSSPKKKRTINPLDIPTQNFSITP